MQTPLTKRLVKGMSINRRLARGLFLVDDSECIDYYGFRCSLAVSDPVAEGKKGVFSAVPYWRGLVALPLGETKRYDAILDHEGVYVTVVRRCAIAAQALYQASVEEFDKQGAVDAARFFVAGENYDSDEAVDYLMSNAKDLKHQGWSRLAVALRMLELTVSGGVPGGARRSKPVRSWPKRLALGGRAWGAMCRKDTR